MLIGRDAALVRLDACLDEAQSAHPSVVKLIGDPGMGKTALLDEVARSAADRRFHVARVTALELEAGIPAAGLGILLPMLGGRPRESTTALLQVLLTASQDGPLLLMVDDAQWLDELSLMAITFAVRRLRLDPVAVVIAGRPEIMEVPGLAGIPTLELSPLSDICDAARILPTGGPTTVLQLRQDGLYTSSRDLGL